MTSPKKPGVAFWAWLIFAFIAGTLFGAGLIFWLASAGPTHPMSQPIF